MPDMDISSPENLSAPPNGDVECKTEDGVKICSATCKSGYSFKSRATIGETIVNKWVNGQWTLGRRFPSCKKTLCEAKHPDRGSVLCEKTGNTLLCSLQCNPGFRTEHTHIYMCDLSNGEWSPSLPVLNQFPQCIQGGKRCNNMEPPENGYIICKVVDGVHKCTPSCKRGFALSDAPDEGFYTCLLGKWSPVKMPVCMPTDDYVDPIGISAVTGIYTTKDVPLEQTGYCMTWGQHHYRTFDGKIYRFQGECSYILVEDTDHFFSVHVHNEKNCKTVNCKRSLSIYVGDLVIELKSNPADNTPAAIVDDKKLALPASMSGVLIQRVADFIVVRDPESELYVKWDGLASIFVRVGDEQEKRTQGLCGTYDNDHTNDFKRRDGKQGNHVMDFVESWSVGDCSKTETRSYCSKATEDDKRILAKALQGCKYIMETKCKYVIDPAPYFEACKEDVCWAADDDNVCDSMSAYFRECARFGVIVDWRDKDRCAITCPDNLCYDVCGSSCPKTCYDTSYNCENDHCIEGCHCPEGTYLHNGTCVSRQDCPCQYGRQEYGPGSKIRLDCNRCVCARGRWVCTKNVCDSVCKAIGNHYTTFDGKNFDFDGRCNYILARTEGLQDIAFQVELINMCTPKKCDRSLKVTVNGEDVQILHGGKVEIGNKEVILPYHNYFYAMEKVTTNFFKVTINSGLTILFDGKDRIYIRAKPTLCSKMRGMCGNFNAQTTDDFWTPKGDLATNENDFGDEWVTGKCQFSSTPMVLTDPCDVHRTYKARARESCELLTAAPFTKCHDIVNYKKYYTNCMEDVCSHEDVSMQCRALADYAIACAKLGVVLGDWRLKITECANEVECPDGTMFKECANACGSSCGALQSSFICDEQCVPGCTCPDGQVFDYNGNCVHIADCNCMFEELVYEAGESRMQDCNVCECHRGKWACTDNICPISTKCGSNEEFTSCMKPEIRTCLNMHLPMANRKIEKCAAGCQCKDSFVWDTTSNLCITPKSCPCYHGGRSYKEGETMQQDCNTCRCVGDDWTCDRNECAGLCRAYGDSHYTTFDGKDYQFHGINVFTLVRSSQENEHSFQISIENVGCGSRGGTCSKRVIFSINLGDELKENSVELVRGKAIQERKIGSFEITYVGLWVFVTAKDLGVTLQWDKGTTALVRLDPEHSHKIEGVLSV
ncbi:von Willebrand factor-like [Clavelina lepadiformis]|uniref:von Willebrand factor-like n=1 Tax=Clavelina lepadiformis TaxID=159417 RepID=UPI0040430525